MYNAVTENDGLKSVFGLRSWFLAQIKAENMLYPMHTPQFEYKKIWGSFSCLKVNYSAKMTCAVGRAKSDQEGVIKSVKDGTWYTFGNLYEIGQVAQAYIRPQTVP